MSKDGGGDGWCRVEVIGCGGAAPSRCDFLLIVACLLARVSIAAALFAAMRDF